MLATLELLDAQQGVPLQSWPLSGGRTWQIGRAPTSDIVISSPFVSRAHASLQEESGVWRLDVLSDKGVFIGGDAQSMLLLQDGDQFQLARKGPLLRFRLAESETAAEEDAAQATVSFDANTMPMLTVDQAQRDDEVQAIAESEYFLEVQRLAESLRKRRLKQPPARKDES